MYDPELAVANKALDQARRELTALRSVLADVRAVALMDPERMALPEERLNQIVTLTDALAAEGTDK